MIGEPIKRHEYTEYWTDEAGDCPFCGHSGYFYSILARCAFVKCPKCRAQGPISRPHQPNGLRIALDKWNDLRGIE